MGQPERFLQSCHKWVLLFGLSYIGHVNFSEFGVAGLLTCMFVYCACHTKPMNTQSTHYFWGPVILGWDVTLLDSHAVFLGMSSSWGRAKFTRAWISRASKIGKRTIGIYFGMLATLAPDFKEFWSIRVAVNAPSNPCHLVTSEGPEPDPMEALTLENNHDTLSLPHAVLEILLPSRHESLLPCCQIHEVTSEEEWKMETVALLQS